MVQAGEGLRDGEDTHPRGHQLDGVRRRGRALDRGPAGELLPAERVVERMQHDVVGQLREGDLLDRRRHVVLGDHDDGLLGVERDRAEIRTVDRQPDETRVGAAVAQQGRRLGGGHRDESQRDVGQALVPDTHPLGGRHPRDIREPERRGYFRACHPARLPVVVRGGAHARYS